MLFLSVFAVFLVAVSSLFVLNNVTTEALTKNARNDLTTQLIDTSENIDTYFGVIESQIKILSQESLWIEAAKEFVPAFQVYNQQRTPIDQQNIKDLSAYYNDDFARIYKDKNDKPMRNADSLLSPLSANAKALQYDFIAGSSFNIGEKDNLARLPNTSDYAKLHGDFHPEARRFLKEFGYYDIFIVDPDSGNIIYSVFKELDFATNLNTGPYANTGISEAFKAANKSTRKNQLFYSQLASYLPSYSATAGFISTPIFDDERKVGVLIFQIPMDRINSILTHDNNWKERGYGDSGETYIVGQDKKLVTESRFFVEDSKAYLDAIRPATPDSAREIELAGTSVGHQIVDSESVNAALKNLKGFEIVNDYRGVSVFSAYQPLMLGNSKYALIAEIDESEALQLASEIGNSLLMSVFVVAIVVLIISILVALFITNKVSKPLNYVGDMCSDLASGKGDLTIRLKESGIAEIDRLLISFNVFIEQVHEIITNIRDDSNSLASSSEELSVVMQETTKNAVEQRNHTSKVSDSIGQLTHSIGEIAETIMESRSQSEDAEQQLGEQLGRTDIAAQKIRNLVTLIRESRDTISSLRTEVSQVTVLLEDINGIADQTNLLALNAAIEAARAGEAGRGFSVVADEVRTLATRSQQTTGQISKIIELMTTASDNSVTVMEDAVVAADQGIELVDTVTDALNNLAKALTDNQQFAQVVSDATQKQTSTSTIVSNSIGTISDMSHDAENGARQSDLAVTELARIAAKTMEMVGRFKV